MNADQILIERYELALNLIKSYSVEPFAIQIARDALGERVYDDATPDWIEIQATVDAAGSYVGQG